MRKTTVSVGLSNLQNSDRDQFSKPALGTHSALGAGHTFTRTSRRDTGLHATVLDEHVTLEAYSALYKK